MIGDDGGGIEPGAQLAQHQFDRYRVPRITGFPPMMSRFDLDGVVRHRLHPC